MTTQKIIYLKNNQITHPAVWSLLKNNYSYDWKSFKKNQIFNSGIESKYVRMGCNNYPFRNDFITQQFAAPVYNPDFKLTFEEITNQRCLELWNTHRDRPWLILWSGGVDSTVILSSILKNINPNEYSNIHIACNQISIFENPHFFYKHIVPNFKLVDSSILKFDTELLQKYYIIDGEPADQLYAGGISQKMLGQDATMFNKNFRTDPDELIKYLGLSVDTKWATWYYENMLENIQSVDIPVETYHDFFWWWYFNHCWGPVQLRNLGFQTNNNSNSLISYLDNFTLWYATDDYQQWAMNNNRINVKYGTNLAEFKLASKQYIYDIGHDEYYLKFKTKICSTSREMFTHIDKCSFCILDDFTSLSLTTDLDKILELLPAHVNL
jgi:hypothetical protein